MTYRLAPGFFTSIIFLPSTIRTFVMCVIYGETVSINGNGNSIAPAPAPSTLPEKQITANTGTANELPIATAVEVELVKEERMVVKNYLGANQ